MNKMIVFDMDGTLADLYNVDDWLNNIVDENPRPYMIAKPIPAIDSLRHEIAALKRAGWTFKVVSWGSKTSSPRFLEMTRHAKINWLKQQHLFEDMDDVIIAPYGTPKSTLTSGMGILFDDNNDILTEWKRAGGYGIDVTKEDLLTALRAID